MTYRDRMRQAAQRLGAGGTFSLTDLGAAMGVQTHKEQAVVRKVASELARGGELARVKPGFYNWAVRPQGQPEKQEIMWRALRARKVVDLFYLQEVSGASRDYCDEFLRRLRHQGVIEEIRGADKKIGDTFYVQFRLVSDQMEMPRDETKATALRRWREGKKKLLQHLDNASLELAQARMAAAELEPEEG
jgi:hypothetical protein